LRNSKQPFKNQDHDVEVAAAQAALVDPGGAGVYEITMNGIHDFDEYFPLPSAHESSCSTSSSATEGNTEGSCTITLSHTAHTQSKELSHHQEIKSTTALAVARLTADRAVNARSGRPPSKTVRCQCMMTEFRLFAAFETGQQYLQAGTLEPIKLATVIKAFRQLYPDSPPSLKSSITVYDWKKAVRANNIYKITMAWNVPEVRTVHSNFILSRKN
jgi:hypothetical protein